MEMPDGHLRCYRCGLEKPVDDFAWRRRRRTSGTHSAVQAERPYGREHYLANRERYIEQARVQKTRLMLERTRYLIEYFKRHPCVDCGEGDPVVLEFDHLRDKEFSIGQGLTTRSWQDILNEIEKCEVVCSNCHRRRTGRRRGNVRTMLTAV